MVEILTPGQVSLETLAKVYWDGAPVRLDEAAFPASPAPPPGSPRRPPAMRRSMG